jgi:hypothetical protein
MHLDMSKLTKKEVLAKMRDRYRRAGTQHKTQILDQLQELFGYHRKAAIRALHPAPAPPRTAPALLGRPLKYEPDLLLPVLKPIWLAAQQPCGRRLAALLPQWLPAYEADQRRLDADVRVALEAASPATLDRLLAPARLQQARRGRGGTRPGALLREQIPIRSGPWQESLPGCLEVDTVALCGGTLDDRHGWIFDSVDIASDWSALRALPNRGQHATVEQLRDVEAALPFALRAVDSDNGGEFINAHLARYLQQRPQPVLFTRSRPYRKNDNAHVEQRNDTRVRQWFGYGRYDAPEVFGRINALCRGPLEQFINHCLPTLKLKEKRREGSRVIRVYGTPETPYARVLSSGVLSAKAKAAMEAVHASLNPFALERDIQRQLRAIEKCRQLPEA